MTTESALVVGGGITGSIAAIALARRGVQVRIVERSAQWFGVGHGITMTEIDTPRTGGPDLPATMGALRRDLQEVLVGAINDAGIEVRLGTELHSFSEDGDRVHVRADGSRAPR